MSNTLRILHLEDDQYDAELARAVLDLGGVKADIRRVTNRREFATVLEQESFDLILADYRLPDFDGKVALDLARAQCPETPFLFISGTIGEETAIEALKQGATDYILKDRMGRLVPSVLRALNEAKERRERRRAQEALTQQERFLASVLTSIQDGIIVLDKDYVILHANPTMELWYAQAGPLLGRKCYEVLHSRTGPCEKCPSRQVFETGNTASEIMAEYNDVGQAVRWMEVYSYPLTDGPSGKMTGAIEYIRDVTQRKKSEEQLRQQAALLNLAREMARSPSSTTTKDPAGFCPGGKGECILVVDDEESLLEDTRNTLERNGYRVVTARNGRDALDLYAQYRADIQLVIMDMAMLHKDGAVTVRAWQEMNPQIQLIATSEEGEKPKGVDATLLGVQVFLHKPFTADTLLKAVHHALGEIKPLSTGEAQAPR